MSLDSPSQPESPFLFPLYPLFRPRELLLWHITHFRRNRLSPLLPPSLHCARAPQVTLYFRSLFVPLRLVVSIALVLSQIYGLSELVFQEHILRWLFPAVSQFDSILWATPVLTFPILVGLGPPPPPPPHPALPSPPTPHPFSLSWFLAQHNGLLLPSRLAAPWPRRMACSDDSDGYPITHSKL